LLIDTLGHILNQCADSIVKFEVQDDTIYTLISIYTNDCKSLGGSNNLYTFNQIDLIPFFDFEYEEKYSSGLGIVYQDFFHV